MADLGMPWPHNSVLAACARLNIAGRLLVDAIRHSPLVAALESFARRAN